MNLIQQIINIFKDNKIWILAILPYVIYSIKLIIDNWKLTDLERLRLSNYKKIQIKLAWYIFFGIIFESFIFINLISSGQKNEKLILITMVFCFIIILIAMILAERLFKLIDYILSFKYDYYVANESGTSLYKIVKLCSSNEFKVESKGIEGFIDVKECKWYKKERCDNKIRSKIYSNKITFGVILGALIICLLLFISLTFLQYWAWFTVYIIAIFMLVASIIDMVNYLENKKFNKNKQLNTQH